MKRWVWLLLFFVGLTTSTMGVAFTLHGQGALAGAKGNPTSALTSTHAPVTELDPLPGDCIDQTPDGGTEPACCISGYVYFGGKPIAGAKITIETDLGKRIELYTENHTGTATKAYYRVDLTAPPLDVKPGDQILLQVEYGEYKKQLAYRVQSGGQQVDFVIPKQFGMEYHVTGSWEPPGFDPKLLNQPNGIAHDHSGNVYLLDSRNARVLVFTADGSFLRQWGRFGSGPGQLRFPTDLTFEPKDNTIYVVDNINQTIGAKYTRIQKFSVSGLWLGQLEVPIGSNNSSFNYGKKYLAVDASSALLFLGYGNKIYKLNNQGEIINSWGTLGSADGQFYNIRDIALDNTGALYVVDSNNDRIQKFNTQGAFLQKWGTAGNGDGQFAAPTGISIATDGTIYIADSGNHRVQRFTSDGTFIAKLGSQGNGLFNFNQPQALSVSEQGLLFVADTGNHRVQAFALTTTTPQWRGQWGSYGTLSCVFNPINALFDQGFLFVANLSHACVSKLLSDGSTWPPLTVSEYHRGGLTNDRNGSIYVTDSTHHQVTKFDGNGINVLTFTTTHAIEYSPGIVVDSQFQIYVTTVVGGTPNNQVDKFDSTGRYLESWQSYGTSAQPFLTIRDLAIDNTDHLYVATTDKLLKFNSNKELVQEIKNAELADIQRLRLDTFEGNLLVIDRGGQYYLQKFAPDGALVGAELAASNPAVQAYPPVAVALNHQYELFVITQGTTQDRDAGAIQIYQIITNTLPIATIQHRSHIATIYRNETLTLRGMGQDSDETTQIVEYQWVSDKNGVLGTTPTLEIAAAHLLPGDHKITFSVLDDEGFWSDPVAIRLTVSNLLLPTATPVPTPSQPTQSGWTMLLYLDGDYNDGGRLWRRFEEVIASLKQVTLPANINLAIQLDGPQAGDTQRWLMQRGPEGTSISTQQPVNNHHEAMMDTPSALTEFVQWGQAQFTNTHYYLSIADHGQAIRGIAWDYTSDRQDDDGTINDSAYLRVQEISEALGNAAIKKIDILHLDACSMNLFEAAFELRNVADFLISSQYLAWDLFPYRQYLEEITTTATPLQVANRIVNRYAAGIESRNLPYTISSLNLKRADAAKAALEVLISELNTQLEKGQLRTETLEEIRSHVQTFETDGDYVNSQYDMYIDLQDWLERLQEQTANSTIADQITTLLDILRGDDPLIHNRRQQSGNLSSRYANGGHVAVEQSNGLSIFYPVDNKNQAYLRYSGNELFTFTQSSSWVVFLDQVLMNSLSPGEPTAPAPQPAAMLDSSNQVFLPLITR